MSIGRADPSLQALGAGSGSKVERIKFESHGLRGTLADELQQETARFSEPSTHVLKFHGVYQQEDRDERQARKAAGVEKAYNFMVRTRIPGGVLTPKQYLAEDDLAGRFANGTLRITTRQGLQLHGVLKGDLQPSIRAINEALLSTLAACGDVNRNVMTCPAPAANAAQAQIQRLAHDLAMHLAPRAAAYHELWVDGEAVATGAAVSDEAAEPVYGATYLPRKFKIGIAFPGDNCVDAYTQDVGLVAHVEGDALVGFTVLVGGGLGMTHGKSETFPRLATPLCFAFPDEVIAVVETIVTIQRDFGDRQNRKHARMKYLVEERGIAWFRAETERRLGRCLCGPRAIVWQEYQDHLGWHRQEDGRWFVGLHVENGRIKDDSTAAVRAGLRSIIGQFAPGIRLTAQQNVLLTDIAEDQKASVDCVLAEHGIHTDPATIGVIRRHALACPALPTCGLALSDAERALPAVVSSLEQELATLGIPDLPLSVRMTGCPNGCARPYMGDIGFVGRTKEVYNIYVGGDWANTRMNSLFAASVRTEHLVEALRPALQLWRDHSSSGESFGDFAHRWGIERLRAPARDGDDTQQ